VACAAALAVIETIERDNLIGGAARAGSLLRAGLDALVEQYEHVKEVRGRGLMLGLVLDQPAAPVVEKMRDIGLIVLATAGNVIRILPPLTVSDDELEEALDIMDDVFSEMHGGSQDDTDDAGETAGAGAASDA
jgi:acetylornithine/succinyldiaminopimelate/putrescine aminotransferase